MISKTEAVKCFEILSGRGEVFVGWVVSMAGAVGLVCLGRCRDLFEIALVCLLGLYNFSRCSEFCLLEGSWDRWFGGRWAGLWIGRQHSLDGWHFSSRGACYPLTGGSTVASSLTIFVTPTSELMDTMVQSTRQLAPNFADFDHMIAFLYRFRAGFAKFGRGLDYFGLVVDGGLRWSSRCRILGGSINWKDRQPFAFGHRWNSDSWRDLTTGCHVSDCWVFRGQRRRGRHYATYPPYSSKYCIYFLFHCSYRQSRADGDDACLLLNLFEFLEDFGRLL